MAGSVSTISQAGSHAPNGLSNDNSLCHLRPGHASEKGLEILSKQGLLGNHRVEPLQFFEHYVYGNQHQTKFQRLCKLQRPHWTTSILTVRGLQEFHHWSGKISLIK